MPDQNPPQDDRRKPDSPMVNTPSQAEGEREHVEETLRQDPRGDSADTAPTTDSPMATTPSQAEGERDHVEETLRQDPRGDVGFGVPESDPSTALDEKDSEIDVERRNARERQREDDHRRPK